MGKVKKHAKEGHDATLSPFVADFIAKCTSVPLHELPAHLATFPRQWDFPKSDLHSWIPVLDRLDSVLERVVTEYNLKDRPQTKPFGTGVLARGDPVSAQEIPLSTLKELGFKEDGDCQLTHDVLDFSAFLLDHSSNRGLYSSQEHVNQLLNTTSLPLLKTVLKLCLPLAVRFYATRARYASTTPYHVLLHNYYNINQERLLKIASSFATNAPPSSHYDAIAGKGKEKTSKLAHVANDLNLFLKSADIPDAVRKTLGDINITYYDRNAVAQPSQRNDHPASPASPTPVRKPSGLAQGSKPDSEMPPPRAEPASSGPNVFTLSGSEIKHRSHESMLEEYLLNLPVEHKYDLLQQLRIAQGMQGSRQDLLDLVSCRILAVANLAYTYTDSTFVQRIGQVDSEQPKEFQLVYQLASLLQPVSGNDIPVPREIVTYAVNALEAMVKLKSKGPDVASAVSVGVSHGILFYSFREVVASLESNLGAPGEREWRQSIITLVHGLAQQPTTYQRSSDLMVAAGVIDIWVQALGMRTLEAQSFYSDIIALLDNFVNNGVRDSFSSLVNSRGLETIAQTTAYLVDTSIAEIEAGNGMPKQFKTKVTDYDVPFLKQQALRQILKFILHMFNLNVGNDRHLRNLIDTPQLLGALKNIIARPKIFGSNIWISAVTIISSFIHSEPTSYNIVHEAGLVAGILDTIAPPGSIGPPGLSGILPVGETLRDIPTAFGAICLNEAGMKLFTQSEALDTYLSIYLSLDHVEALESDQETAIGIGSAFDELVRHHPDLKDKVAASVLRMVKMVVTYCQDRAEKQGVGAKLWTQGADGTLYVAGGREGLAGPIYDSSTVLMEREFDRENVPDEVIESDRLLPNRRSTGRYTSDVISVVCKFLQGYLSNANMLAKFCEDGGVVSLLELTTGACNPWNFHELSTYDELTRVFLQIQESKPHILLPLLVNKTKETLLFLRPLLESPRTTSYFAPLTKVEDDLAITPEMAKIRHSGTHMVKAMVSAQVLINIIADIFAAQGAYGQRPPPHTYFTQINLTDMYIQMVDMLGQLHSACICESIFIQNSMPEEWKQQTKVKGATFDNAQANNVMGQVSEPVTSQDTSTQNVETSKPESKPPVTDSMKSHQAAFRNYEVLRHLLGQIPNGIPVFLQHLGKSLYTKSRGIMDGLQRQNAASVAERIAAVFIRLLDAPFSAEDGQNLRRYQIVTLTTMLRTYIDKMASYRNNQPELLVVVLNQFFQQGGFEKLNAWVLPCYEYIKTSKPEESEDLESRRTYSVACLSVTLDFYSKIVSSKLLDSSPQGSSLNAHTSDPHYAGYFEPAQLLLEIRNAVFPVLKTIWSPDDGDNAIHLKSEDMKAVITTLKHILQADGENKIRHPGRARGTLQRRRWKPKNSESLQTLISSGIPRDLALEALFRCNDNMSMAREYCALRQHEVIEAVDRLPPSEDDIELSPPPSQDASRQPSQVEDTTPAIARVPSVEMQDADETAQPTIGNVVTSLVEDDDARAPNASLTSLAARTTDSLTIDSDTATEARSSTSELPTHQRDPQDPEVGGTRTLEELDKRRMEVRESLVDRCIDVLNELTEMTFDVAELIQSATAASRPSSKELKESIGETLALSLVSLSSDENPQRNKRIAAVSHLMALVLEERDFFETTIDSLKANFDYFVGLLRVAPDANFDESTTHLSNVLLVMERMLIEDEQPAQIEWQPPTADASSELTPLDLPPPVLALDSKQRLFAAVLELLPRIGKNELFALSVIRILVMLTRRREIAKRLSEKPNIGRLFLMVKQLAGLANVKLQSGFLTILRHMVEDEQIIKQIMKTEIVNFFEMNRNSRSIDTSAFARHLYHLVLRDPTSFVEVSSELLELNRWDSQTRNSQILSLKRKVDEVKPQDAQPDAAIPSREESVTEQRPQLERMKTSDLKPPAIEHPDGVIQFILKELSSYRDVEDNESTAAPQGPTVERPDTPDIEMPDTTPPPDTSADARPSAPQPKTERALFKTEEHPIFTYRCTLLQCLSELLSCYTHTKAEFISYSPKSETIPTTPSKPRTGLLNYMLTTLVPVGTLQHQDEVLHRKKLATSNWTISVIVALCSKTQERSSQKLDLGQTVEDEPELTYVRRVVLEQVLKALNSAMHSTESLDMRYSRFLALSDIINKMLTQKPSAPNIQFNNETFAASTKNIGKLMYEKNFVSALTAAVAEIDLNFPNAKRAIKYILRPLKYLIDTAVQLSLVSDSVGPGAAEEDDLSSSSSITSDDSNERDATPDIFRNSTLAQFEPDREESESSAEENEDDYYDEGYDEDEMDYEDERPIAAHGDVVSDDDEDVDGMGPIEGMPGDVNMDIEVVMDGDSEDDSDNSDEDDEDSDSDDDDDDEDDGMDDGGSVEIIDEIDGDHENDSDGEEIEDDEGDWEDEDGEEYDEEAEIQREIFARGPTLTSLARAIADDDQSDLMERLENAGVTIDRMEEDYFEDEMPPEDDDEGAEEYDEEVVYEPEAEFDEEEDDEDEDELPSTWQPEGRFFRQHHHHHHGRIPPDPWNSGERSLEALTAIRSHRGGIGGGRGPDDGSNPLLHRNDTRGQASSGRGLDSPFNENTLFAEYGIPTGGRFGMGRSGDVPSFIANLLEVVGPPGSGGRVEFFSDTNDINAFQPVIVTHNGGNVPPHLRHTRPGALSNLLRNQRIEGSLPTRNPTHDPGAAVSFTQALTVSRWQDEARLLFGSQHQAQAVKITNAVLRILTPAAVQAKRQRDKEEAERKAAQEKALEEQRKKDEQERKKKAEEERKEREEQEKKEAEEAAERAREAAEQNEAREATNAPMEGVEEAQVAPEPATEPAPPAERRTAIVRGSEVDITELGIDQSFLDEIPEDMREDVIMAQLQQRLEQQRPAQPEVPAVRVPEEIDREFLSALPAEIQQELLRAEATERSRRDRDDRRRAAANANNQPTQPEEMDTADFMAMLDPNLRQSVLLEAGDEVISGLPAGLRAEAEALFGARRGMPRIGDLIQGRHRELSRQSGTPTVPSEQRTRKTVVQVLDKAGVATLLRLMFVTLTGTARSAMMGILTEICKNVQNRAEVISILLSILQDGSSDGVALDKSFAQLTMRAKQMSGPKTPQPLRRTLTGQQVAPLHNEASPLMIVQQCLSTLTNLVDQNQRVATFFLTEHEMILNSRAKTPKKGKAKESKAQRYPINALLSLLDRRTIIENSAVMELLAGLLVRITESLKNCLRRAKEEEKRTDQAQQTAMQVENTTDENNAAAPQTSGNDTQPTVIAATGSTDVAMNDANQTQQPTAQSSASDKQDQAAQKPEERKRPLIAPPPEIPEENLCLIVNIIAARECSGRTFQNTLDIVNHLSAIPGARDIFGNELVRRASELGVEVLTDLKQLPEQIRNAESNTEMQGRALSVFSPASSHQNKLLRVLLALDYIFDPKRTAERGSTVATDSQPQKARDDLVSTLYDNQTFITLWESLSDCLTAIRERGNMNNVATILQPLIEAFMVVCKNTTVKEPIPIIMSKDFASPPPESRIESQFFRFTEEHRKILNDLVRHNPKLMSGTFDVLVKNSKVLEFDNKRNFFNKRLHTKLPEERVPHQTLQLNVRRSEVFLDSFKSLFFKKPNEIKYGKLNIRFAGEEGVDAGGVTREWFAAMSRQMFNPNYALFNPVAADRTTFHPNPLSVINEQHLTFFKFIGRIIGKALYENRVLDCHFSRAVYKRILGKGVSLKDMETLDLDYYKSLMWMLENDITDVAFETFSVEVDRFGETETVDLKPNGRNVPVTEDNKHEYVKLVVEQRLTKSVEEQLEHFLIGFREIVPLELISIFNEQELELLISGLPDIDVDDWKNNTEYHNYSATSAQVQWFWRAVRSFDAEEKAKLLQFVTGTSKVPLNGFKELEGMNGFSRFNIHRDFGNKDRLPSSHTCFNQLDLPEYESYEALRRQLYTAMTVGSDHFGFA